MSIRLPSSRAAVLVVVIAVAALTAVSMTRGSGDVPGGQFDWENQTGGPLFHDGARIQNGGGQGIPVDRCGDTPFVVQDRDGQVVARLNRWCDGQRWVVRGPDDATLEVSRNN